MEARALWVEAPGQVGLRQENLGEIGRDQVLVETLYSGVSRGTERLVLEGKVPESERGRMRCPFQDGDFPAPVKYGYASVGRVADGPSYLKGLEVFCLYPHQDRFVVPEGAVIPLPAGVPAARAVLAANMETALNIVWDSNALPGDRIAVVGAGVVGLLTAWLMARIPGTHVTVVDVDPAKALIAKEFSCSFTTAAVPVDELPDDCDIVVHASGHPDGLATALAMAGFEARVVEASWYGDKPVSLLLGGAFHSKRLQLVSSQVGHVAPVRRVRRTLQQRLRQALELLQDAALDRMISGETAFRDLAADYPRILNDAGTLCHRIRYR